MVSCSVKYLQDICMHNHERSFILKAMQQAVQTSVHVSLLEHTEKIKIKSDMSINNRIITKFRGNFWYTDEICHCEKTSQTAG